MIRLVLALALALSVAALSPASAQKRPSDSAASAELGLLMNARSGGFAVTQALLSDSFAAHLHGPHHPETPAALSAMGAGYDPDPSRGLTPAMALFHIARPVEMLHEDGSLPKAMLARLIEARLLWLAGDEAAALAALLALLAETGPEGAGWSDPAMTSALADAAVLAHRAGHEQEARAWFDRALACANLRCPQDLVFNWTGPRPTALAQDIPPLAGAMRQVSAEALARRLFPASDLSKAIDTESRLASGQAPELLAQALQAAAAGASVEGDLAARLLSALDFESYLMLDQSTGATYREIAGAGGADAVANIGALWPQMQAADYLGGGTIVRLVVLDRLPAAIRLLRASNRRGDALVADLLDIRILLAYGETPRAAEMLADLARDATAEGYTASELASVWLDLFAVASVRGDPALQAMAAAALETCRVTLCADDLALRLLDRTRGLPESRLAEADARIWRDEAVALAERLFPGDRLKLADIFRTGPSATAPIDAARSDLISLGYAESASGITPQELADRAAAVMDTLIYAAMYDDAAQIGDRIARRVAAEGAESDLSSRFHMVRARAAFRLGDPAARKYYAEAVDIVLAEGSPSGRAGDLALDLLDTDFLDLLDRLLTDGTAGSAGMLARLRLRQGRAAEAAAILSAERRRLEQAVDASAAADDPALYARFWDLKALAWQEAVYRDAAGEPERAAELRGLGGATAWFNADWPELGDRPDPASLARYEARETKSDDSYDLIRPIIEFRDQGNYEAAAQYLRSYRWVAEAAEANGEYVDAQTLWQMAFTFVRAGETDIAFDLMDRAARIAATLSFNGAGGVDGGTLQLLERDRWRYLLFVDIAWAAVTGTPPSEMTVVSRY